MGPSIWEERDYFLVQILIQGHTNKTLSSYKAFQMEANLNPLKRSTMVSWWANVANYFSVNASG